MMACLDNIKRHKLINHEAEVQKSYRLIHPSQIRILIKHEYWIIWESTPVVTFLIYTVCNTLRLTKKNTETEKKISSSISPRTCNGNTSNSRIEHGVCGPPAASRILGGAGRAESPLKARAPPPQQTPIRSKVSPSSLLGTNCSLQIDLARSLARVLSRSGGACLFLVGPSPRHDLDSPRPPPKVR